ncbi:hypothetical protein JYK04_00355 [Streptomyces nojiriensis]|nr:hypothetical protein JYK04_00355 [Streptomyces nojiriensis]
MPRRWTIAAACAASPSASGVAVGRLVEVA